MVAIANHGGSCCGARHLWNFDTNLASGDTNQIVTELQAVPFGRRVEVILNERQVTNANGRRILDKLQELGFVLSEHYLNHNHNPPRKNFVFTRCDTRRRFDENLPFAWGGQFISPGLTGDLPRITAAGFPADTRLTREDVTGIAFGGPVDHTRPMVFEDGTPAIFNRINGDGQIHVTPPPGMHTLGVGNRLSVGSSWYNPRTGGYVSSEHNRIRIANSIPQMAVGATVQVTRPQSEYFNRSGQVTRIDGDRIYVVINGDRRTFARSSLRVITGLTPIPAPAAPVQVEPHRHTQGDAPVVAAGRATAPQLPRIVYTTYHNVLQRGTGAGWTTLEACREAAPRCRQQLRRDIMSDGNVVATRL